MGLEVAMRETLLKLFKAGMADYVAQERKQFVTTHYGQVVATISQIQWCLNTESYINDM